MTIDENVAFKTILDNLLFNFLSLILIKSGRRAGTTHADLFKYFLIFGSFIHSHSIVIRGSFIYIGLFIRLSISAYSFDYLTLNFVLFSIYNGHIMYLIISILEIGRLKCEDYLLSYILLIDKSTLRVDKFL